MTRRVLRVQAVGTRSTLAALRLGQERIQAVHCAELRLPRQMHLNNFHLDLGTI